MTIRQRWTLVATVIGSGAVFLDGTVVNVALPRIGRELPATIVAVLEGQAYVVSGYLAVLAALLILAGALSDHYGRKRVYAIGLAGFAVSSALCGLSPSLEWLIVFRLIQGGAGALLVPGALSLITQAFQGAERGRAFGIWAASTSALTVLGPIVGGVIVDTIGWRFAFLINVPLLALALWVTIRHLAESRDKDASGRFDWLGAGVAALAVGGLAFGLIRGQAQAWADGAAWVAIAIGAAALVLFPILMATRPNPLVPLGLFRQRAFATINLATFFIYGALYVTFSYQALVLQNVLGYTALGAGAVGIPTGILLSVLSTRVGTLAGRFGARRFLVAGPMLMALAMLWYASACRFGTLEGGLRDTGQPDSAARCVDRRCPGCAAFRRRDLARRGAVDEHPDELRAEPVLGSGLGNQQLHLESRPTTAWCDHLRRHQCHLLRQPRIDRAHPEHRRPGRPAGLPTAQPAARWHGAGSAGRSDPCLH